MSAVAILPARGGSKRIPRKNIRPLHGVPLIVRAITILQRAGRFDRIVVSTDDEEIAGIAGRAGADIPFMRPAALADDTTGTRAVMAHAIEALAEQGQRYDLTCCTNPAAVLVGPEDYHRAFDMIAEPDCDYVLTATEYPAPIQRALRRTATGGIAMLHPEHALTMSQDFEVFYHDAGQFNLCRSDLWLGSGPMYTDRTRMLLLPRGRVVDIDTEEDWQIAEWLFSVRK
ncbi:MAG: pseudaminic acid cytidylyltransferase [Planctomycetota bacterium]